jgi:hypothetical protein
MASSEDNEKISPDNLITSPDESSKLLSDPLSKNYNGPTSQASSSTSTNNKPMLIRQDRTYLTSPQLSATGANLGCSEESADDFRNDENVRSAPDMLQDWNTPKISISSDAYDAYNDENAQALSPLPTTRCRTCRRSSTSPTSIVYFDRSTSKDSIVHGHLRPHLFVHHHSTPIPPVFVTNGSPSRSTRIIRQSSQPEPSSLCGSHCTHAHQTTSLRQLKDPSDALSGIAADALRISGGMKSFKQVSKVMSKSCNGFHFFK